MPAAGAVPASACQHCVVVLRRCCCGLFARCLLEHPPRPSPHTNSHTHPVGQWLLASSSMTTTASSAAAGFPPRLAALQWAVFVLPSLLWIKRSGWDLPKTLKLQPSTLRQYVTGEQVELSLNCNSSGWFQSPELKPRGCNVQ